LIARARRKGPPPGKLRVGGARSRTCGPRLKTMQGEKEYDCRADSGASSPVRRLQGRDARLRLRERRAGPLCAQASRTGPGQPRHAREEVGGMGRL